MNQYAKNVQVKVVTNTNVTTFTTEVNAFLTGGGTPALGDAKVVGIHYRPVDVGGTLTYTVMIAYVE